MRYVFDAAKVHGKLRVHAAQGGEQFAALDGKTYTLRAGQMSISDDQGVEDRAADVSVVRRHGDEGGGMRRHQSVHHAQPGDHWNSDQHH